MKLVAQIAASIALVALIAGSSHAQAINWKQIAVDSRSTHDGNSKVVEIDLGSISRATGEVSVTQRETAMAISSGGYSCREGDIQHGITSAAVAAIFCHTGIPDRYPGPHQPTWVTFETRNTQNGSVTRQYDSAGLYIINHGMASLMWRDVSVSVYRVSYDCRGNFRRSAEWQWLDTTDKIAGVPRGYVSPERQISNWICAK